MKKLFLLLLIVFTTGLTFAQTEKYSKVKIYTDEQGLQKLSSLGIAVDEGFYSKGMFTSDFSETELKLIRSSNFQMDILVDDVVAEYLKNNEKFANQPMVGDPKLSREYPVPYEFQLGTMGGHCTLDQFNSNLDYMFVHYPNLITEKVAIGQSIENRPIYMVKLTGEAQNDPKPQVLYTGVHHAREGIGAMHLMFYMYYLLENYATDPEIKNLVDHTEMYFILVVNPDGYRYNQTTNPSGGGMWRKNRHNNGGGSYGVDINRNYGYMWGGEGSSGYPDDETYRGTAPFSEPETAALKAFCESHHFGTALNYHCVAGLLLYAWGYTPALSPDNDLFHQQAALMTAENNYTYGPANTTIYVVSGSSDDWMYGEQTTKPKILAYTPEIAGSGFWPAVNEIIPLCQENMLQSILAAKFVGNFGTIKDEAPAIISQTSGYLKFSVSQLGLDTNTSFSVSITPLSAAFTGIGDSTILGGILPGQMVTDSISYLLDPGVQSGTVLSYVLNLNDGYMVRRDTIHKIFGQPIVLFNDLCSTLGNWTPGGWAVTTSSYHSAPGSITDSPNGNYQDNINKSITLTNAVDLTTANYAALSFWAKWDIESGYDYVQVKVSINGGSTWTPLAGNYTHPGTSYQIPGSPLYDGTQSTWVQENIDLTSYVGHSIKLRFTIVSDGNVTGDGFYFDDISVITIGAPTGHMVNGLVSYPNAGNTPLNGVQLNLRNGTGTIVASTTTNQNGNYSFDGIADGTYTIEASTSKTWGGVTAADVLLYKKHIANISSLYGIFLAAGDVNVSGTLTAADVLLIRKRIAYIVNSFTSGDWLFNPLTVIVNGNNVDQSFNGLTYGDANGSYQPVSVKNTAAVLPREGSITIGSAGVTNGQLQVPVSAGSMTNLGSFQFTIRYDSQLLTFKDITGVHPGLESLLVGTPEQGILTFVWAADENGLNIVSEELFSVTFIANSTSASDITFSDTPTTTEFGDFDGNLFAPAMKSGSVGKNTGSIAVDEYGFAVYPNPSHGQVTISSNRNNAGMIDVKVTDQVGKTVFVQTGISISANGRQTFDLNQLTQGIYFLTITDGAQSFVKKVVIL